MIQLDNISLAFGGQRIFSGMSWFIKDTARVGLVGPNGAGKTTLLRILSGRVKADSGSITVRGKASIGYLQQEVLEETTPGITVLEQVVEAFDDVSDLEKAEAEILKKLDRPNIQLSETDRLLHRLDEVHAALAGLDAHRLEFRAQAVLAGLGFADSDMGREVDSFSGGWRMRMSLATLLLQRPDLLLLDEPTNHLDIETIDWLEQYLANYAGAIVMVSHDRYILDRMTNTTAEVAQGKLNEYAGNYSFYLAEREERMVIQQAAFDNQQREIKQAEAFIRRFKAKATKARQAQSRVKMLGRLERLEAPTVDSKAIRFKFPEGETPGRVVLDLSSFSKTYSVDDGPDVKVFDRADPLIIERGDRIALLGKNGAGKSTLARIMRGTEPFEGERKTGIRVNIGFFAQSQAEMLDPSQTVLQAMQHAAYGWDETRMRGVLGAFLFDADDAEKSTAVLSGGEKSRLALALTLVTPANLLILDEPTNHLDIRSRNALVQALDQFPGTYVVISHDRHFIDQVAKKVWYVADGKVRVYHGAYSDLDLPSTNTAGRPVGSPSPLPPEAKTATAKERPRGPKTKEQKRREAEARNQLSRSRKQLKQLIDAPSHKDWVSLPTELVDQAVGLIESRIAKKEREKVELEACLADPAFYSNGPKSDEAIKRFDSLNGSIKALMDRWEQLQS